MRVQQWNREVRLKRLGYPGLRDASEMSFPVLEILGAWGDIGGGIQQPVAVGGLMHRLF